MQLKAINTIYVGEDRYLPGSIFSLDDLVEARVLIDGGFAAEHVEPEEAAPAAQPAKRTRAAAKPEETSTEPSADAGDQGNAG